MDDQFAAIRTYLEHALSENGHADLEALRHAQTGAVRRVGSDAHNNSVLVSENSAHKRGAGASPSVHRNRDFALL